MRRLFVDRKDGEGSWSYEITESGVHRVG
jgi:hypothetical protein